MVSELRQSFAREYLFLANILNTAKIEKLVVPDVVQKGSTNVMLDCLFASPSNRFTVQWWFNNGGPERSKLVYEWSPPSPPIISGILVGRLNMSSKVSTSSAEEYRAIRLLQADPDLSGEYTCVFINNGLQVRESKRMLVYSPEEEFELTTKVDENHQMVEIICLAHGVYPQPDLIIEYNKEPIAQQTQRVWHKSSALKYDAVSTARLRAPACRGRELTCRLHLPQADYTAIKMRCLTVFNGEQCNQAWRSTAMESLIILVSILSIIRCH